MIFEALYESVRRGELILVDGGMCHWHLRRDKVLVIREIIVTRPGQGIGTRMLEMLKRTSGAETVLAKCPADLSANVWYARRGFEHVETERTRSGRMVNVWRLNLSTALTETGDSLR